MSNARAAVVLVVVGCLSGCTTYWKPTDPRLVRGAGPEELGIAPDPMIAMEQGLSQIEAHLDEEFPNLTLIDYHNRIVMLHEFRGKRIAILAAVGPCPHTTDWLHALDSSEWQPPTGYDELVVLVSSGGSREFNKLIRQAPSYLVGWPLPDYLAYVRWYPIMYGIDQNGRLQEFWGAPEETQ